MKLFIAALFALSLISCTKATETSTPGNDAVSAGAPVEMAPPNDLPDPSADLAPPAQVHTEATPITIQIAAKDRACVKNSDCQIARVQCSCHCGEAVNKAHVKKYQDQAAEACKSYSGKMCKMLCRGEAKCVKKVCTYVP